eukprot:2767165-Pleurochrysis_carterae.AAC.3
MSTRLGAGSVGMQRVALAAAAQWRLRWGDAAACSEGSRAQLSAAAASSLWQHLRRASEDSLNSASLGGARTVRAAVANQSWCVGHVRDSVAVNGDSVAVNGDSVAVNAKDELRATAQYWVSVSQAVYPSSPPIGIVPTMDLGTSIEYGAR